jgi:fructosamine-3-kinase
MFEREAEGLAALQSGSASGAEPFPRVPLAYCYGNSFLLLEDLKPAPPGENYWEQFGRQLAHLHQITSPQFGFDHDNYIGSTPQRNPWVDNGFDFFSEYRLRFQARLAQRNELLDVYDVRQVEAICQRLPELIPSQPASLLHGDLWSGNAITDSKGAPAIIDPAVYYGWSEAELAMTSLFGGFPETFYEAYQEEHPLEPGYRQRFPIYNLYHLLNHLNLFGTGYLSQVRSILHRFG